MTAVVIYTIQQARPWLAPERFMAHLKTTASGASWAIVDRLNGRRFKVGATAFLTLEAADKRRLGLCARALQAPQVRLMNHLGHGAVSEFASRANPPKVYDNQIVTS